MLKAILIRATFIGFMGKLMQNVSGHARKKHTTIYDEYDKFVISQI